LSTEDYPLSKRIATIISHFHTQIAEKSAGILDLISSHAKTHQPTKQAAAKFNNPIPPPANFCASLPAVFKGLLGQLITGLRNVHAVAAREAEILDAIEGSSLMRQGSAAGKPSDESTAQ
jgi:hypothetical protein